MAVTEEHFNVIYDGEALQNHEMDAHDLASAVLALSEAFQRAQRLIVGGSVPPARLQVKAFNEGSFDIWMALIDIAYSRANTFLQSPIIQVPKTAGEIVALLWATFEFIKAAGGRQIAKEQPGRSIQDGYTLVTFTDGTTMEIPTNQVLLFRDVEFREQMRKFIAPVDGVSIDTLKVNSQTRDVQISHEDVASFDLPPLKDKFVSENTRVAILQPLGVEFDDRKWRFSEGSGVVSAKMEDEAFLKQIDAQEVSFGKSDILEVQLKTRQYQDKVGKLKSESFILRVLDHRPGDRQIPLDFDFGDLSEDEPS